MAITFNSTTSFGGRHPEFWRGEAKVLPGGFKPSQSFTVGAVIHRGTPVLVDFGTMSAVVLKAAGVIAGGNTKSVRLAKGHLFEKGDAVTKLGNTGVANTTVASVDKSNMDYDVVELATAITGLAEGDILVEAGTENGKAKYDEPNAVLAADCVIKEQGIPAFSVAYEAAVLYPTLPNRPLDSWLNGFCLKKNPNIIYIKQ